MKPEPKQFTARIYTLSDETGNIFYVGCTINPLGIRLDGHIKEAMVNSVWMNRAKIDKIRSLDYKIFITEVDSVQVYGTTAKTAQHQAHDLEKRWIEKFRSQGAALTNRTSNKDSDFKKGSKQRILNQYKRA